MPSSEVTSTPISVPNQGFLLRAQKIFLYLGIAYALLVVLLTIPIVQLHVLYCHSLRWPLFARFDLPAKYGLSPSKTLNLQLTTSDNVTLGAWFTLSDPYYQSLPSSPDALTPSSEHIRSALASYPTILYFHGNAATRAVPLRVQHYTTFSSRLHANVLAIDYRGFGDSEGTPSEDGLIRDGRAAWDWLMERGVKGEDVLIVGLSLGTGVSVGLAKELSDEGMEMKGVVLLAPFESVGILLDTYMILGLLPVIRPLQMIPGASGLVRRFLIHKFDTISRIRDIKAPILLAHSEDDWDIPVSHSEVLFEHLLEPHLPSVPSLPTSPAELSKISQADWDAYATAQTRRKEARDELVLKKNLEHFGSIQEFSTGGARVVFTKTVWGGHDRIGLQEGVQDAIGRTFGMGSYAR
ncbi:hypothetical protein JAAARDRAFT_30167 [Jaapia argillacea MUCL 33604]|uniref:AB hydrolase-1 domain-containing protein n=1 Tax=Jaapia argillacea MUCL 33604 TaxID=933084 RepID=A0A067Q7X4_9AGAM|nr:hypothetical protein JAAARDRAFT_30167 [Jaapia argillacea MUCL 33604]